MTSAARHILTPARFIWVKGGGDVAGLQVYPAAGILDDVHAMHRHST